MNNTHLKTIMTAFALTLSVAGFCTEPNPDSGWTKAADNRIYAQSLVNEAMAKNPDLVVIGIHASRPGSDDQRMVATNLDRVGKEDDEDDKSAARLNKTVLVPNPTDPTRFEVLMPMEDSSGNVIGAAGFVFKYRKGDDQVKLLIKATSLRNEFAKKIKTKADLFKPIK
ncbi:MAG: hypothetical protein PHQ04_09455 [Opitutaceae bacterium]|nr:hypothetical protein [Opitutaceae bacterium]